MWITKANYEQWYKWKYYRKCEKGDGIVWTVWCLRLASKSPLIHETESKQIRNSRCFQLKMLKTRNIIFGI